MVFQKSVTRRQFVRAVTSGTAAMSAAALGHGMASRVAMAAGVPLSGGGSAAASAVPLTLSAFEASGERAGAAWLKTLLLTDSNGTPYRVLPQVQGDGTASIELPPGKFEMMMVLPVRDFGQVYLYADNGGTLYPPATTGKLLLNYEFARSRAAFVRSYVRAAEAEGVVFSPGLTERLSRGEAAVTKASGTTEESARARYSNDSLADTMWAGETAALERAKHRIARNGPRQGFLFGCNAFRYGRSEEFARLFRTLFNFGTVPFYRARVERTEGQPDYGWVEAIVGEMAGSGILIKGHPLIYFIRSGIPEFLASKPWPELKQSCRDYILGTVGHFRSRIHVWDVINEAHDLSNNLGFNHEQLLELTRLGAETTQLADPTAFRVVNSCCTWGEYTVQRGGACGPNCSGLWTPYEYLKVVEAAKVPYEAVGLQLYNPVRDMLEIERHVERFFVFGKPIHLTEFEVPSANPTGNMAGTEYPWHGTAWTPQVQADWAEQFYTIFYSKPQIEAITWWDFTDPAFIEYAALVDEKFQPKPVYDRLKHLFSSWRAS